MSRTLEVDRRIAELLPPLHKEQLEGLEADIVRNGCLAPLIVWQGILIDGHHRYAICRKHNIPFEVRQVNFPTLKDAAVWVLEHHKQRRNMTPYMLVEASARLRAMFVGQARERKSSGKQPEKDPTIASGRTDSSCSPPTEDDQNSGHGQMGGRANRQLAKVLGISHDTVAKAVWLERHADQQTKQRLRCGETTIHAEYTRLRRQQKARRREARRAENARLVQQAATLDGLLAQGARFATIVLDPPWDWGDEGDGDQLGRARPTYATMPLEKLLDLPVARLADSDCHLYLWITNRSLPKGFLLLQRWGFRYITAITWCKPHFGMGNYFRGATEHVLFGVRGSQPLLRKDVGTWFTAPRGPLGHSSKPPEFYRLVESCSPGPYLEMFARSRREGWVSWGAEADAG